VKARVSNTLTGSKVRCSQEDKGMIIDGDKTTMNDITKDSELHHYSRLIVGLLFPSGPGVVQVTVFDSGLNMNHNMPQKANTYQYWPISEWRDKNHVLSVSCA
jgi:hypothetical protein